MRWKRAGDGAWTRLECGSWRESLCASLGRTPRHTDVREDAAEDGSGFRGAGVPPRVSRSEGSGERRCRQGPLWINTHFCVLLAAVGQTPRADPVWIPGRGRS